LDVQRALQREPEALPALEGEFAPAAGRYPKFDAALARWRALLADSGQAEFQARRIACDLARLWQAALLIRHAPEPVARGFVGSRLGAAG
ncbi:acyl-CoA dehydrogenase, partial [Achromobacter sp. SIMBA_011]